MVTIQHVSPFGQVFDEQYMRQALQEAQKAYEQHEVPIGAVVINAQGAILARAYNSVEHDYSQSAHAEMKALEQAGKALRDWRLDGCWVYVTLEPCGMCLSFIMLSRCAGVVFAAPSPLFGSVLDNGLMSRVYKEDTLVVVANVLREESAILLQSFFRKKREQSE